MDNIEDAVREAVSDRIGREMTDATWRDMYGQAMQKLRHIVTLYGDAGGARNTPGYIAQLTIEAIQAEGLRQITAAACETRQTKREGAGANADPQGHTTIILQQPPKSQAVFA